MPKTETYQQEGITFTCDRHGEQEFHYFTFGGFTLRCGCEWTRVPGVGLMRVAKDNGKPELDVTRRIPLKLESGHGR